MTPNDHQEPKPDQRQPWQIAQGLTCGCRGADDMCVCQNEIDGARRPLSALVSSPMRDYHTVTVAFRDQVAARAFRDSVMGWTR